MGGSESSNQGGIVGDTLVCQAAYNPRPYLVCIERGHPADKLGFWELQGIWPHKCRAMTGWCTTLYYDLSGLGLGSCLVELDQLVLVDDPFHVLCCGRAAVHDLNLLRGGPAVGPDLLHAPENIEACANTRIQLSISPLSGFPVLQISPGHSITTEWSLTSFNLPEHHVLPCHQQQQQK